MKKTILFLFIALLGKAQIIQLNNWQNTGNTWGSNTSFIGNKDNYSFRIKTNNALAFSIDSNKVFRMFNTTSTSTTNGSFWFRGDSAGYVSGFNFYNNNVSNTGTQFTIRNSHNFLSLYQDHTTNNWFYTGKGQNIVLSVDSGVNQAYTCALNLHAWNTTARVGGSGNNFNYQWSCPASTSLTAATEYVSYNFNGPAALQFQDGTLARQRGMKIGQGTVKFITGGAVTEAAAFHISGAPIAGTNCTLITNSSALMLGGITGSTSVTNSVTNSYGLSCYASQGAVNNYSARFMGGSVGIGTVAPTTTLDVRGNANISSSLTTNGIANTGSITTSTSFSAGTTGVFSSSLTTNGIANTGTITTSTSFSAGTTGTVTGNLTAGGFSLSAGSFTVGSKSINTTTGDAATINSPVGRFRKDVTGTTFTLTNSFITANSIITLTQASDLTQGYNLSVVAGAGSAVITFWSTSLVNAISVATAPTSDQDVNFIIMN